MAGRPRTTGAGAAIESHVELQQFIFEAAEKSTAIVVKEGKKRGGRKHNARQRELMTRKVSMLSGDSGKALLPSR